MNCFKFALLLSFVSTFVFSYTGVIDLITGEKIKKAWLSFGVAHLNTAHWIDLESSSSFQASGPNSTVVLMSLPDLGGPLATQGIPTATRIRNVAYSSSSGKVSFQAKIFVPNDTSCLKTWYQPVHLYHQELSFLVAEKGVFLLSSNYTFVVSTGQLNRTTNNLLNRSNWFYFNYPRGCGGNYAVSCSFPNSQLVSKIGVIATLQSLVFNTYLLLRVFATQRTRIGMILTPHDSLNPNYFTIFDEFETAGYVVFPTGFALTCIEGIQFETASFFPITSNFFQFPYRNTYAAKPYIFGMLVTQNSLTDSTSIRVFNNTNTRASAITQEDQCASEQVLHTTEERVTMFIFSLITPGSGIYCFSNDDPTAIPTSQPTEIPTPPPTSIPTSLPTVNPTLFPTYAPTVAPTFVPTTNPTDLPTGQPTAKKGKCFDFVMWDVFGDGWDNQLMEVEHLTNPAQTTTFGLDCKCRNVQYCFDNVGSANGNVTIIVEDPSKDVRHGWEAHWTFVDDNGVVYVGNQFSTLQLWRGNATCFQCIDYSLNNTENECDRCRHPPPKAKPGASINPVKGSSNSTRRLVEDLSVERYLATIEVDEIAASYFATAGNSTGHSGAAKPKRPPLNLPFVLIDESTSSSGWYDGTGSTMDMCGLPTPTVLTYPKYYISNAARTKLIHSGTICGPHSPEKCQEVLPYDGKFVWRVGGYDANPDDVLWHFCTVDGGLGQELSFTMKNGKCIPGDLIDATDYCNGIITLAVFVGQLQVNVQAVEDHLSVAETRAFEAKLSKTLFFNSQVAINSYEKAASGDGFLMTFTVTVRVEEVSNFVGTVDGQLDDFTDGFLSTANNGVSSGTFFVSLQDAVTSNPNLMSSQLSAITSISMLSLEFVGYDLEVQDRILDRPFVEQGDAEEVIAKKESLSDVGIAAVAVGAVLFAGVFAAVAINRHQFGTSYGLVANSASEHGGKEWNLDDSQSSFVDSSTRSTPGISMTSDDEVFRFSKKTNI